MKLNEIELPVGRMKQVQSWISDDERKKLRKGIGQLRWVFLTCPEIGYELSRLSSWVSIESCTVQQLNRCNKVIRYLKGGRRHHNSPEDSRRWSSLTFPQLSADMPLKVLFVADSAEPADDGLYRGKWHESFGVLVTEDGWWQDEDSFKCGLVYFRSGATRRCASSPFDGETLSFVEAQDVALGVALLIEEFEFGVRETMWERKLMALSGITIDAKECEVPTEGHTDSESLVKAINSLTWSNKPSKRRKGDIFDLQELKSLGIARESAHIDGVANPFDSGTKAMTFESVSMQRLREIMSGLYEPVFGKQDKLKTIEWSMQRYTAY